MSCKDEKKVWFKKFFHEEKNVVSDLTSATIVRQQMDDYFDTAWKEAGDWVRHGDRCPGDNCRKAGYNIDNGRSQDREYNPRTKVGSSTGKVVIIAVVTCEEGKEEKGGKKGTVELA